MRILIINIFYYPDMVGGTEHSIKLLAENLAVNNCVAVYCLGKKEKLDKEMINGVTVFRGNRGNYKPPEFNRLSVFNKVANKLIEINNESIRSEFETIINSFAPDVIHVNNLYGMSTIIWKISHDFGIPIIHTLRDYELLEPIKQIPMLSSILNKKRSSYVSAVTSPSKFTLDKFVNAGFFVKSKKIVVQNAIYFDMQETRKIINGRMLNYNSDITFLFVGMLTYKKGIENLLRVFSSISDMSLTLLICGQGELEYLVKDYSAKDNRIKYLGQLDKEQLKKIYIASDVLIVPSVWEEPFGRVVIEGNQYGLPVIGANKGGIKEIINNIQTGELFNPEADVELKEKITKFSNREYIKMFYNNIIDGIDKYSIQNQISMFEKVYQELLKV